MTPDLCRRTASRFSVRCPAYYSNGEFHASGVVENLTDTGGCVHGTYPVNAGMSLVIFVIPPEPYATLLIRRAIVRWANGTIFGLELSDLDPTSATELARIAVSQLPGLWSSLN